MTDKKLQEIYETEFKPNYENKNYSEAQRIFSENPGLEDYMTNSQMKDMIKYVLGKNASNLKEVKANLEKIVENLNKK